MGYREEVLRDGPVHYWRFNETSGTTAADSAGGSPATINGAGTNVLLNQVAALLDDTSPSFLFQNSTGGYLTFATNPSADLRSTLSIEVWLKTSTTAEAWIVSQRDAGGVGWQFNLNPSGTLLLYNNAAAAGVSWSASGIINDGSWHHAVAVVKGTSAELWVDGQLRATASFTWGVPATSVTTYVGKNGRDNAAPWYGNLQDLAFYSYALPGDRIIAHYTEGRKRGYEDEVLDAGALAYWPLNDRFDRSGYGRHLTETNAPVYTATNPIASAGKAATFNGTSNYLQIARDDSWMAQQYHSEIIWFRTNATGRMIPLDRDSSGSSQRVFTFEVNYPSAGQMQAVTYGQNNTGSAVAQTSGLSINDNAWHMAVRTHGTDFYTRIFVDGVERASASLGAASGTGDLPIYVGVHGNISFLYQGDLAHVSYHAGALTAAQVRRIYAARLIPPRRAVTVG